MILQKLRCLSVQCFGCALLVSLVSSPPATAGEPQRSVLIVTSTNGTSGNDVLVFKLATAGTPSLSLLNVLHTGGKGGASTNAGSVQFHEDLGAVANHDSSTVTQLARVDDSIVVQGTINLVSGCANPDSVALSEGRLFIVGATCAESHLWPSGSAIGSVVPLTDRSAAQIVVGKSWGAVTFASGAVLQLSLGGDRALDGVSTAVTLPSDADNTPLGAGFWGDVLGFTPAHSPDSFAIVNKGGEVFPITGPTPPYPTNAPCWVAKGPGNVWYTGNAPGDAISIFFSDAQGGTFYKSVPLPGSPTDITVSADRKWLAVIYTAGGAAHVATFAIDQYGDLSPVATSNSIGVAAFNGVAISQ